jgi:hypothetical protein
MKLKPAMTGHRAQYEGGKEGREGRREGPVTAVLPRPASARHQQILIPMPPWGPCVLPKVHANKNKADCQVREILSPIPRHFLAFAAQQASQPPWRERPPTFLNHRGSRAGPSTFQAPQVHYSNTSSGRPLRCSARSSRIPRLRQYSGSL